MRQPKETVIEYLLNNGRYSDDGTIEQLQARVENLEVVVQVLSDAMDIDPKKLLQVAEKYVWLSDEDKERIGA